MTNEEKFTFLLEFLANRDTSLNQIQQDIVRGTIRGITYEEMQPEYSSLRYRSISTIKRIDAPKLWQKINHTFTVAGIENISEEKIGKKNLSSILDRLTQQKKNEQKKIIINNQYEVITALQKHELETIYLAYNLHLLNKPKCVVKQLANASTQSTIKLERQARVLENLGLKSDRIPQLYAYFQADNYFYLILEYIEGTTLKQYIKARSWQEKEVISFLQDILEILDLVHKNNTIHRCITPDNLICRQSDNRIALVNFDAVKCLDLPSSVTSVTSVITVNNYAAPELIIAPKPCSDLYSVGKIASQLLTGLEPKKLPVNAQTLDMIFPQDIYIDSKLAAILETMTRYDFKQRYQSAREIIELFK